MKSESPTPSSKRTPSSLTKIAHRTVKKMPRTQRSQFKVQVKLMRLRIRSSNSQTGQSGQDSSTEANTPRYCPPQPAEEGAGTDGTVTSRKRSRESWEMYEAGGKKSSSESDSDSAGPSTSTETWTPRSKKEVPVRKKLLKTKAKPVSPSCSGQSLEQPEQNPQTPRKKSRSRSSERQELPSPQKEELRVESRKRQSSDSCEESKGGAKKCRSESSSDSAGPSTRRTTRKHHAKNNESQRKKRLRSKAKPVSPSCSDQTQEYPKQTSKTQRSRPSFSERPSQEVPRPSVEPKESSEDEELYKLFLLPFFRNKYKVKRCLKEGVCGTVYTGVRRKDNLPVAIKRIPLYLIAWKNVSYWRHSIPHEVEMMARLGAWPNVEENDVTPVLLEWFKVENNILLVLKRPEPCMDLIDHLNISECCMSEEEVRPLFRQLVDVTIEMMSRGVFHRDIKPSNILLDWEEENEPNPRVRLIDFSCAIPMDPHRVYRVTQGTVLYLAPEVFRIGEYQAYPSTVWQLGLVLYIMLHSERPFDTRAQILSSFQPYMWEDLSDECKDLLTRLMDKNPNTRISMDKIKEHPWLREEEAEEETEGETEEGTEEGTEGEDEGGYEGGDEEGTQGKTQGGAEGGGQGRDPPIDGMD